MATVEIVWRGLRDGALNDKGAVGSMIKNAGKYHRPVLMADNKKRKEEIRKGASTRLKCLPSTSV